LSVIAAEAVCRQEALNRHPPRPRGRQRGARREAARAKPVCDTLGPM